MTIVSVVVCIGLLMIIAGAFYGIKDQRWAWFLSVLVGTSLAVTFSSVYGREAARQEFMNELSKDVDLRQVPVKGDARFRFDGHIIFLDGELKDVSRIDKTTVSDPFAVIPPPISK